jgi:hypothetical protein
MTASKTDVANILDRALNGNSENTIQLLEIIRSLRESNAPKSSSEKAQDLNDFLDTILEIVDESNKPVWTKIRYTCKFSKRSRLAALDRLLNISTPSASNEESDTIESKRSRRRRSLVVALRSLISSQSSLEENQKEQQKETLTGVSIYNLEKAARKSLRDQISSQDMESRLPPGLETPKYTVITKYPKYEIRNYESALELEYSDDS